MSVPESEGFAAVVRRTLVIGVAIALVFLLLGIVLGFANGTANVLAPPTRIDWRTLPGLLERGNGPALILLGVLVIVVTPIARVAVSIAHFARSRDASFSAITVFVLAVLLVSVIVGIAP